MKRILIRLGDNDFSSTLVGFANLLLSAHRHDPEKIEAMTIEDIRTLLKNTCRTMYLLYQQRTDLGNVTEDVDHIEDYLKHRLDPVFFMKTAKDDPEIPQSTLYILGEYRKLQQMKVRSQGQDYRMQEAIELLQQPEHAEFVDFYDPRIYFDDDIERITKLQPRLLDSDAIYIDFFLDAVKEEKEESIQNYYIM